MSGVANQAYEHLKTALEFWIDKYNQIFTVLTTSPEDFQGGVIWTLVGNILTILQGIGISLVVLFFFYGLFMSGIDYRDIFRNPKTIAFSFVRPFLASFFVTNAIDIMLYILQLIQSIMMKIQTTTATISYEIPDEIKTALEGADWWASIGAWASSLIGQFLIGALSIIIMVLVYGRFFKIFLLAAISPIPLAGLASEKTEYIGNNFMKSYIGECLRGILIVTSCLIFSAYFTSPPASASTTAGAMVFTYVLEVSMQMLILVIMIKGSDRLVKEFFSL